MLVYLLFVAGFFVLIKGADILVEGSSSLARRFNVSDLVIGLTVVADHPIHKFPMDAWAVSLGEGTQDVQKLVIFREIMKQ